MAWNGNVRSVTHASWHIDGKQAANTHATEKFTYGLENLIASQHRCLHRFACIFVTETKNWNKSANWKTWTEKSKWKDDILGCWRPANGLALGCQQPAAMQLFRKVIHILVDCASDEHSCWWAANDFASGLQHLFCCVYFSFWNTNTRIWYSNWNFLKHVRDLKLPKLTRTTYFDFYALRYYLFGAPRVSGWGARQRPRAEKIISKRVKVKISRPREP